MKRCDSVRFRLSYEMAGGRQDIERVGYSSFQIISEPEVEETDFGNEADGVGLRSVLYYAS